MTLVRVGPCVMPCRSLREEEAMLQLKQPPARERMQKVRARAQGRTLNAGAPPNAGVCVLSSGPSFAGESAQGPPFPAPRRWRGGCQGARARSRTSARWWRRQSWGWRPRRAGCEQQRRSLTSSPTPGRWVLALCCSENGIYLWLLLRGIAQPP